MRSKYNIDDDMQIQPFKNGVRLLRPEKDSSCISVSNMMSNPFNTYFLDHNSVLQKLNERTVSSCGFISVQDAIGRTVKQVATKETADHLIRNDKSVMHTKSQLISDDSYSSLVDADHHAVSIKFPWYDKEEKIIGVFGCSIVIKDSASVANAFSLLLQTGLVTPTYGSTTPLNSSTKFTNSDLYITQREMEIVKLLKMGYSAKKIALILGISDRTVERHLENIKAKFGVTSKQQLLDILHH